MSHQLHGFGSEMDMGTTHNIAGSGRRLEFRAEFKQAAWIHQEAYFRIVVPGMYVPSFLPLSLQILGKRSSDNMLKEPFHLTNIRVDLLEFSCVPSKYTEATDIRSKVLFEKETSMEINSLNSKLMIPPTMYDCVIPQVGPTFFIGGFTRTYGLKITLSICNKRVPRFNVSAFIELHVAQKRYERIHEQEIYNPLWHFLGCNKDEMARGQDHFMKRKPLFPYPSYPFGEENIPLSIRVSLNGNTQFYQSREGSYDGIASPGMELNKFVRCTFIVAQGFKEASQYRQVDDIEFCLEQIKITLEEEKLEDDELSSKEIPLLDDRKSRFIRWSEFKDAVAGSELARAMTSELEDSRSDEPHSSISGPLESVNVQGGSSKERVPPSSACDRNSANPTEEDMLGFESGKNKPTGGDHGTFPGVPKADNSLSNQESSTEASKSNENDTARNNPKSPYDEEMYLQILRSDDPVWDFLHHRAIRLEEKGDDMTDMEVSELDFLRGIDNDLRWGRFLGGENPGQIFLRSQFYRDILDTRIRHLINVSWSEDEVLQKLDPVQFYLIWRSKKQSREKLWAEHWGVDPETTVHVADLDDVIRNLPQRETARVLKRNDRAHDCCNKLLTRLLESDEILYEPEIRYLERLLEKSKPSRLWSILPPAALAINAAGFFGSMKNYVLRAIQFTPAATLFGMLRHND
ncbi:uncharacterized protein CXQ87_005167 [Candidozyma duobushaemuli]|uniref:Uncharacterized protein n=1 Tax=Candidozyma duobushaemuli TaxID=1231522 RepID=A0A2V1ADG9_9ASCO|nr:uncharacterized protein CXQ87_005167 [[Candida] duobushaemulonis]PVH14891.1 hypothetical protein CXQ87_005167 [[Candida] duobushaemulonis]